MEQVLRRTPRLHAGFPLTSMWKGFTRFFGVINEALEAKDAYTRLSALSDAELARRGLTRGDIPQLIAKKYF